MGYIELYKQYQHIIKSINKVSGLAALKHAHHAHIDGFIKSICSIICQQIAVRAIETYTQHAAMQIEIGKKMLRSSTTQRGLQFITMMIDRCVMKFCEN